LFIEGTARGKFTLETILMASLATMPERKVAWAIVEGGLEWDGVGRAEVSWWQRGRYRKGCQRWSFWMREGLI
jgi:hypothetical protein